MDQINFMAWEGRTEVSAGGINSTASQSIAATLNLPQAPKDGDLLPPLWHWCAFPNATPTDCLGSDGHPPLGGLLPPSPLRRRMWAGGDLSFHAPLRVGEPISQNVTVRSVTPKQGATGPMLLVSLDRHIFGASGLAVQERQNIVYLDIPDTFTPPKKRPMPAAPAFSQQVDVSPTMLFRFSAVTFNAHRIHYDLDYARTEENYPGLVVHGPLQAMLLMQAAVDHRGVAPVQFSFRGVHPLFAGTAMDVVGVSEASSEMSLFTGQDGHQGMQATAIWEGTL